MSIFDRVLRLAGGSCSQQRRDPDDKTEKLRNRLPDE